MCKRLFSIFWLCLATTFVSAQNIDQACLTKLADQYIYKGKEETWLYLQEVVVPQVQEMTNDVARLSKILSRKGIILLVVPVPARGYFMPELVDAEQLSQFSLEYDLSEIQQRYDTFITGLHEQGVFAIDLLKVFEEAKTTATFPLFYTREFHWTPAGARVAALETAKVIAAQLGLQITNTTTQLQPVEVEVEFDQGVARKVQELCGVTISKDTQLRFTLPELSNQESGLFSSSNYPVIATGSSFSVDYQFVQLIQAELDLDIPNYAVESGAFVGGLLDLFLDDTYLQTPPRLIVWEFPAWYRSDRMKIDIRELIPAALGQCSADTKQDISTKVSGNTITATIPTGQQKEGQHYIHLTLQNMPITEGTFELTYASGYAEVLNVSRTPKVLHKGEFYLETDINEVTPLHQITFSATSDISGDVGLTLCPMPSFD
jgi:SGNH hydrolase-like domain, acetyltransferase AlgX